MFFEEAAVYPRITKSYTPTTVHGKLFDIPRALQQYPDTELKLFYIPDSGLDCDGKIVYYRDFLEHPCCFREDGTFSFEFRPQQEGEYTFKLMVYKNGEKFRELGTFSCYALDSDLYDLVPWKGDTHVHTLHSACGKFDEEPSYAAATARERGLDFVFITDHIQRDPSIFACDALKEFSSDFSVYPGEECHAIKSKDENTFYKATLYMSLHQLSLGASYGVSDYTNEHFEEYQQFIEARKLTLDQNISEDQRTLMAAIDWIVDKTHEFGGISIFAHPFWRPSTRLNLAPEVRQYILNNGKFDAIEVFGLGSPGHSNASFVEGNCQCANWLMEESIRLGRRLPVTGSTDSHNARALLGYQYTLLFAEDDTLEAAKEAIKSGKTVAVSNMPGQNPFMYGSPRLVQYACFLLREYFPEHDEACAAEGKLMLRALRGECSAELVKSYSEGLTEGLWKRFSGKNQ